MASPITGLQPSGTSIPGNDGYPVDNLVRTEAPRLTMHGFGYASPTERTPIPSTGPFAKPDYYAFSPTRRTAGRESSRSP